MTNVFVLFCGFSDGFKIFKIQLGLYNPKTTLEIKRTLVESFMSFYGNDFKYYDTKDISKDLVDCRLLDGANTKTYCAEYYVDSLIKDEILPDEGTKVELIGLSYGNLDSSGKSIKLPIGQFIIIDFNKNFNGEFIILEGKSLVDKFGGMSRIKLEDNEFEGKFDFFGTDQIEGRYILTPSLIQRIKCYQGKMNSIKISFVKNKIYIIKVMKTPIFDVKMDRSLYDMEPMLEYYNVLNMIYGIVDELNLNTRIWTR